MLPLQDRPDPAVHSMREGIPGPDLDEVRQRRTEAVELDKEVVTMKGREGRGVTGVVLTIVLWLVAITLILETGAGCSPAPGATTPSSNPPVSTTLKVGDNVTLDQGGGATMVAVAATTTSLDEWTKSTIANDTLGQKQMLADGSVYAVDRGTSALIIDIGAMGVVQVRIYSGNYSGKSGWIPVEWAKKLPVGTVPVQDVPKPSYTVQVTGTKGLDFDGSFIIFEGGPGTIQRADGTVPATFYVSGSSVWWRFSKMGGEEGAIKITIIKDGKVVKEAESSEQFADISGELPESP